ncbi:MAG: hypothetical protein GXP30_01155, partial [Verrucomicrobia bacterium]|nr:hypothetical protein [Verrucomicrobiota bacterium]
MQRPPISILCSALVLILLLLPHPAYAQRSSLPKWKQRRSALDQVHIIDEFRIYYTLQGDDALPETHDLNNNGIPDRIENIALQLTTARDLYTETFKLRHPLESSRYKNQAQFIDVNVGSLPLSPTFDAEKTKGNGSAGDEVVNYYRPGDPEPGSSVLTMDISKTLDHKNLTPAHELFHLFQSSYTMFKASWFAEGTARWVEFVFREGSGRPKDLPYTKPEQEKLFAMKYDAEGFWSGLAQAAYPQEAINVPSELLRRTYVGSNDPVVRDTKFRGALLIKPLLEALDKTDDQAVIDFNLKTYDWSEAQQRSPLNNPYILSAIIAVASKHASNSQAIRSMVQNLPTRSQHTTLSIKGWMIHLNGLLKRDDPEATA